MLVKIINRMPYLEFYHVYYGKYDSMSIRKGNSSVENMIPLQKGRNYR